MPSSTHQPGGELYFEEVECKGFRRQDVVMEKDGIDFGTTNT